MDLLRHREVKIGLDDRIYRHARVLPSLIWIAALGADAALLFSAMTGRWKPGYLFGPAMLLFLLVYSRFLMPRFHTSNWLVRTTGTGVFIHFRSYLNPELPDGPSVVFFRYNELSAARLIRERVQAPDASSPGTSQTQFRKYVELEFAGDPTPLADALQQERAAKPLLKKRWYGSSSTSFDDHPISLVAPQLLRIHWDVSPRAAHFLAQLGRYVRIEEPLSIRSDFTALKLLSQEEQRQHLRDLAMRGEPIVAAYIARQLYGLSLAEAIAMVDELKNGKSCQ